MTTPSIKSKAARTSGAAAEAIKGLAGYDSTSTARILAAATEVSARYGYDAPSLREVARQAGVPMALASYDFGGKAGLYRDIFEARTQAVVEQRKAGLALAYLETDPARKLDMIVKSVLIPMLKLGAAEKSSHFGTLLAHEVSDPQSIERGIIKDIFDPVAEAVMGRLAAVLPDRSKAAMNRTYQILIGAVIYTMGDAGRIARLGGGAPEPQDVEPTVEAMLTILLDGIRPR